MSHFLFSKTEKDVTMLYKQLADLLILRKQRLEEKFQVYSSWYSYGRCMGANTVWGSSCCVHDCLVIDGGRCSAVSANGLVLTICNFTYAY